LYCDLTLISQEAFNHACELAFAAN